MTIEFLGVFLVAALLSGSLSLAVSGVLFGCLQLLHQVVFGPAADVNGVLYAVSAMSFDLLCLLIVALCSSVFDRNWHLIPLSIIILLSIVNDLYGLTVWRGNGDLAFANRNGDYIYMAVAVLLVGSRFSGGVIMACRNFINRNRSFVRWLSCSIERDS